MTKSNTTIVVGGFLGLIHAGGAVWDYIQYPLGFYLMGYDVYYIEDTRLFPIYTNNWQDSSSTIYRLKSIMESFGMGGRWIYRDEVTQTIYGKTEKEYQEICKNADIFLNVSCANVAREEYSKIPVRILLDSDPMFTQIQINSEQSFTSGKSSLLELANWHTHYFTFGENVNASDCLIPESPFDWKPTRQPVCLKYWGNEITMVQTSSFTTLMNWKAGKPLNYNNKLWGQKDVTFPTILSLPQKLQNETFKIAISQTGSEKDTQGVDRLKKVGWNVVSSEEASGNHSLYQSFIFNSIAEISVAKETYVKAITGWFSCRSACYLAAGRPVIAQDTGWSHYYPCGKGLFAFTSQEEAIEAITEISKDCDKHSKAASEIAHEFFDHKIVLKNLLEYV